MVGVVGAKISPNIPVTELAPGVRMAPVSHLCPALSIPPGPLSCLSLCPPPTIVKIDSTFLVSIMPELSPAVRGSIEDNDRSAPSPNAKHRVLFRVRYS